MKAYQTPRYYSDFCWFTKCLVSRIGQEWNINICAHTDTYIMTFQRNGKLDNWSKCSLNVSEDVPHWLKSKIDVSLGWDYGRHYLFKPHCKDFVDIIAGRKFMGVHIGEKPTGYL